MRLAGVLSSSSFVALLIRLLLFLSPQASDFVSCETEWTSKSSERRIIRPAPSLAQLQRPTRSSDCDLLSTSAIGSSQPNSLAIGFSQSEEALLTYCQCQGIEASDVETQNENETSIRETDQIRVARVGQLKCLAPSLRLISTDLTEAMVAIRSRHRNDNNSTLSFKIDYLHIETKISQANESVDVRTNLFHGSAERASHSNGNISNHDRKSKSYFLIDHLTIRVNLARDDDARSESKQTNQMNYGDSVREQMRDFCGLIYEPHLQFFSILLDANFSVSASRHQNPMRSRKNQKLSFDLQPSDEIQLEWLLGSQMTGLVRLEVNGHEAPLGPRVLSILITKDSLRKQEQLKWLDLSFNQGIKFAANQISESPFVWLRKLEYLSLESCNLRRFHLLNLLGLETKQEIDGTKVVGHPNLMSLNLASNRLTSIEKNLYDGLEILGPAELDLESKLCARMAEHNREHSDPPTRFLLASLTQLDLSRNKIQDFSSKVGQLILCTMPNLSHLYLQQNLLVHLNLNSLLLFPFEPFNPKYSEDGQKVVETRKPWRVSRLELLDLSSNQLAALTAFSGPKVSWNNSNIHIESINLNSNRLTGRPVTLIDPSLLNIVIHEETFNFSPRKGYQNLLNLLASFELQSPNYAANPLVPDHGQSICDFLSTYSVEENERGSISEILMSHNQLSFIKSTDFASSRCKTVQILRLSGNRIENIEENSFNQLQDLEQLDLSENRLDSLGPNLLHSLKQLRIIDISGNRLINLASSLLGSLNMLEEIYLARNNLTNLSSKFFEHNPRLSLVDLSMNQLTHLDESIFGYLPELRILKLDGNRLRSFKPQHLLVSSLSQPTELISNSIESSGRSEGSSKRIRSNATVWSHISYGSSMKMSKGTKSRQNRQSSESDAATNELILSSNQLDSFQFGDTHCPSFILGAHSIWLDRNRLRWVNSTTFKCSSRIQRIELHHNLIEILEERSFDHLTQLEYLDLSWNLLTQFHNPIGLFPPSLRYISMKANKLESLDLMGMFLAPESSQSQLESIDLSLNPRLDLDLADLSGLLSRNQLVKQIQVGNIDRLWYNSSSSNNLALLQDRVFLEILNMSSISLIDDLVSRIFSNHLVSLERLDLSNLSPQSIGSNRLTSFLLSRLQYELVELYLLNSQLAFERFVSILENSTTPQLPLSHLDGSSNSLELWPFNRESASKLSRLKRLNLNSNQMRYLFRRQLPSSSYEFHHLEQLDLSRNTLISLTEDQILVEKYKSLILLMPKLRTIDLSYNRLTWIPIGFFDGLEDLTELRLNHNQLESPIGNIISNLRATSALTLDFTHNQKLIYSSMTTRFGTSSNQPDFMYDFVIYDDLILFENSRESSIICQPIEEYLITRRQHQRPKKLDQFGISMRSSDERETQTINEMCSNLLNLLDTIKLDYTMPINDSSSPLMALDLNTNSPRLLSLSLRNNNLRSLSQIYGPRAVQVTVAYNKIQDFDTCKHLKNLMSLDLSHNQLRSFAFDRLHDCNNLNYIDLSFNRIDTLRFGGEHKSRLMVVKLQHNRLINFNQLELASLASLVHIDLRFNQLGHISPSQVLEQPLIHYELELEFGDLQKPMIQVKREASSIQLDWSKLSKKISSIELSSLGLEEGQHISKYSLHANELRREIKFCSLVEGSTYRMCLLTDGAKSKACVDFKSPSNVPRCLTNLREPSKTLIEEPDHSALERTNFTTTDRDVRLANDTSEDPVLSMINFLKVNWIKLKQFNLNEHLAFIGRIQPDSVWLEWTGYPIYTLTVIKIAIVSGAISIVSLLIAMFILLTHSLSSSSKRGDQGEALTSSSYSSAETSASTLSNGTQCNQPRSNSCHGSSVDGSSRHRMLVSNSSSGSNKGAQDTNDAEQLVTQLERKMSQLEASLLAAVCATPNSSLAPSSIETAETMQAIDSIQSSSIGPHQSVSSVDHYTNAAGASASQQQQPPQVATVMRMVKSSSANNFERQTGLHRPSIPFNSNLYGTINSHHHLTNYHDLKTRIRAIHEQQLQEVEPPIQPLNSNYGIYSNSHEVEDPATLSLLSINSSLAATSNSQCGQRSQPANLTRTQDSMNLCQYHQNVIGYQPVELQVIPIEESKSMSIYEGNHPAHIDSSAQFPPPPPASRAIEALQDPNLKAFRDPMRM